jgi:hypothetical protein
MQCFLQSSCHLLLLLLLLLSDAAAAAGDWPADCLPRDGGYGGRRTNNTRCLGV